MGTVSSGLSPFIRQSMGQASEPRFGKMRPGPRREDASSNKVAATATGTTGKKDDPLAPVGAFVQKLLRLETDAPTAEDIAFRDAEMRYTAERLYEAIQTIDSWDPEVNFFKEAMRSLARPQDAPPLTPEETAARNLTIQKASERLFRAKQKNYPIQ